MQGNSFVRKKSHQDQKLNILILQIITVLIIFVFALGIKFFGGELYRELSVLYHEKFDDITRVSDVLKPNQKEKIENANELEYVSDNTSIGSSESVNSDTDTDIIESSVKGYIDDYKEENMALTVSANEQQFLWPVSGEVSSEYGYRNHPITKEYTMHGGIDISADEGTEIKSAYAGKITHAGYSNSYGYYVIISHSNNIETLYAHCSKLIGKEGESVKKGQTVALVGSTGRSTGPHLHFEIRIGGCRINPRNILGKKELV